MRVRRGSSRRSAARQGMHIMPTRAHEEPGWGESTGHRHDVRRRRGRESRTAALAGEAGDSLRGALARTALGFARHRVRGSHAARFPGVRGCALEGEKSIDDQPLPLLLGWAAAAAMTQQFALPGPGRRNGRFDMWKKEPSMVPRLVKLREPCVHCLLESAVSSRRNGVDRGPASHLRNGFNETMTMCCN